MSVLTDVINAVAALVNKTTPFAPVTIGTEKPLQGISLIPRGGVTDTTFLEKSSTNELFLMLNGKHDDQETLMSTLDRIHRALVQAKDYPSGEGWQITNIQTENHPFPEGYDESMQLWEYSSDLLVKFFYMKG